MLSAFWTQKNPHIFCGLKIGAKTEAGQIPAYSGLFLLQKFFGALEK